MMLLTMHIPMHLVRFGCEYLPWRSCEGEWLIVLGFSPETQRYCVVGSAAILN